MLIMSGPGSFHRGEIVPVLYNAVDPGTARVQTFWELWLGTQSLTGFGLLCLGSALVSLRSSRVRS